jgi:hypothetical protein
MLLHDFSAAVVNFVSGALLPKGRWAPLKEGPKKSAS